MPQDLYAPFSSTWIFTKDRIIFPTGEDIKWNDMMDWISVSATKYIVIKDKHVRIGLIETPCVNEYKFALYGCVPKGKLVRGWLLDDSYLISPKPDYEDTQILARFPIDLSSNYYGNFPTLLGTWVTHVVCDSSGEYFALYDYEDDYTVVFNKKMERLGQWRCGSYPVSIEQEGTSLQVKFTARWEGTTSFQTITLPEETLMNKLVADFKKKYPE